MKIADIELGEKPLLLAPMEDVTDPSFRYMCKRFGADMVYTEFISSDGLIRDAAKSLKKLEIDDAERPVGIQIYGHLIDPMVEAARMAEAIRDAKAELPVSEALKAALPETARTLHRLLGSRPDTRHFRHHPGNPLMLDVLVVDEASMVDLEMMAALLAALPESARLILLGDKDQLASVEAGALLSELCQRATGGHYLPQTRDWLQTVTGENIPDALVDAHGTAMDQAVVMLRLTLVYVLSLRKH
jgi:exodeoxyribonuclease V alpha subunit